MGNYISLFELLHCIFNEHLSIRLKLFLCQQGCIRKLIIIAHKSIASLITLAAIMIALSCSFSGAELIKKRTP